MFIDEYHFLDSAYRSALKEIGTDDSLIRKQDTMIVNNHRMLFMLEDDNAKLKYQNMILSENQIKWWHYAAGGGLLAYAVYITYRFFAK